MTILQSSIASNVISGATGATGPAGTNGTNGSIGATGGTPWTISGANTYFSGGNVGINNSSPGVLTNTTQVAVKANVNGDSMFVAQNSNGLTTAKFGFQFSGGIDQPVIGSYTDHPLVFLTNNTERMRIGNNGLTRIKNSVVSNNGLELGNSYTGTGASYGVKFGGGTNSSDYCISGDNAAGTTNLFNFRGDGLFQFNSGFGSAGNAYGCRAWASFNGSGGISINGSGNVSSITRDATGTYTVNFSNAMPDANFSYTGIARSDNTGNPAFNLSIASNQGPTTSNFSFFTGVSNSKIDSNLIYVAVFR